ncbi:guanylyltransferase [Hymenobacter gummosus]|uniref:tRNA(His) guanylyltransferase n=1 Tax=Hymenobacter gummosus TaxID=1776032 RepID=A0A431U162_9BACT|nr:tRNA(His) guanylyltransferase Thg1 family protein [Hymenobacter gummosus]RTQ48851.1 guanylyltransferase [Hymenobacter gummosus]
MKFNDLDARLRVFETAHDHCALPGLFLVARLDGRGFTRLTKEVHAFEAPFDERVRALMVGTTEHLMQCGFRVSYGYTQSDEISLLLDPADHTFGRKLRKLTSVLAGEASAKFTHLLGDVACFDCRISQLPRPSDVIDYFRWRQEDAHRNSLNAHCYWLLRRLGHDAAAAHARVKGLGVGAKHELLFEHGTNYHALPAWQKRGVGVYWATRLKDAFDPIRQQPVQVLRRALHVDYELPLGADYAAFVQQWVGPAEPA